MDILRKRSLKFPQGYEVSRKVLSNALSQHKTIDMVFDIHRDSTTKDKTTITIKGLDFARIVFIVSGAHDHYQENLKFVTELHNKIEKKYPGLSRGVFLKDNGDTQSTYNQDIINQSVLLEIGGVENTLEEEYRSADVLADIFKKAIEDK